MRRRRNQVLARKNASVLLVNLLTITALTASSCSAGGSDTSFTAESSDGDALVQVDWGRSEHDGRAGPTGSEPANVPVTVARRTLDGIRLVVQVYPNDTKTVRFSDPGWPATLYAQAHPDEFPIQVFQGTQAIAVSCVGEEAGLYRGVMIATASGPVYIDGVGRYRDAAKFEESWDYVIEGIELRADPVTDESWIDRTPIEDPGYPSTCTNLDLP